LANPLYSAGASTIGWVVIGGLINSLAKSVGVGACLVDRVLGFEQLKLANFELMEIYKVKGGYMCWIYPENWLMTCPNVEHTTLLNRANLSFLLSDEELVYLVPPTPPIYLRASSSFQPSFSYDLDDMYATFSLLKMSKRHFEIMSKLSMVFSVTLFRRGMMSFVG